MAEVQLEGRVVWLSLPLLVVVGFSMMTQTAATNTIWSTGCKSWYQGDDGRNLAIWPGYTVEYWLETRKPKLDAYVVSRASTRAGTSSVTPFSSTAASE